MSSSVARRNGRRPKIAHLTSAHSPSDTRIFGKMCRTLVDSGFDVVLVVPSGRDGIECGVRIHGVPKVASRRTRMLRTTWQVYRAALRESADVYHFHDPELMPWAFVLRLRGRCVVMDAHEDLPKQILAKHWIPRHIRPVLAIMAAISLQIVGRAMNAVVAATPKIAQRFPAQKTFLVQNYPILAELQSDNQPYAARARSVVYVGGISQSRGVREVVDALAELPNDGTMLLLAGACPQPEFEADLRERPGWSRVEFLGWQSRQGVRDVLGRARVGLVTLYPTPNHLESQPIKLYEYMSAALPIVASDFPLWRRLIEDVDCGVLVDPSDPEAIAKALVYLLDHPSEAEEMGRRGRKAVETTYNWPAEAETLLAMYREVLA